MGIKITNKGDKPVVSLYGVIGSEFGGVTADMFRQELATIDSKTPIELRIHSEGGSYFDGIAMHSQLKSRKGAVSVIVDGLAASAASLVAMAGKTIEMAAHSWLMIHEGRAGVYGTAGDLREYADRLDVVNSQVADVYSGRWKGSKEELVAALAAETWLTAEDAIAFGLADAVTETMAIAARVDGERFGFTRVPEVLINPEMPKLRDAEERLSALFPE